MGMKNKGLGRGLSALITNSEEQEPGTGSGTLYLNTNDITPNPNQPRRGFNQEKLQELAESIKTNGLLQPLIVRTTSDGYELVAGERRWRACTKANLTRVPVIVRDLENDTALAVAMIENLQREDLDPMEKASGMERLRSEANLSQEQIARELGISRTLVTNTLRLLKLPAQVQKMLAENKISSGHARSLLGLSTNEDMLQAAREVVKRGLNVRQTEKLVQNWDKKKSQTGQKQTDKNLQEKIKKGLSDNLGQGIEIDFTGDENSGKITLKYSDADKLQTIMSKLDLE